MLTIKIIRPASKETSSHLPEQIDFLEKRGFKVLLEEGAADQSWTYSAGKPSERADILTRAVLGDDAQIILCARGGYGASDLLPLLPWDKIKTAPKKLICGFSDISALHAGFYTFAGWPGMHSPMPATTLWRQNGQEHDVDTFLHLIKSFGEKRSLQSILKVTSVSGPDRPVQGILFGGCFTVLSNLIGTPYIPTSLENHILFIEDTDENPARLIRALNQWIQSGLLKGVSALIVGHLRGLGEKIPDCADYVYEEFAKRVDIPVFKTTECGHCCPNMPLLIGAKGTISNGQLSWQYGAQGIT